MKVWEACDGATMHAWSVSSQVSDTALIMMARAGHTDMVELLVDREADLNAINGVSLETALLRIGWDMPSRVGLGST